jgi:hypothetical protein
MMIREKSYDTTLSFQITAPAKEDPVASPFRSHQLQVRELSPSVRRQEQPDWVFAMLFTGFFLVAWMLFFSYKRFYTVVSASFSKRHLSQLTREGDPLRERIGISLSAVYILATSLTIYQLNQLYFVWQHPVLNGFRLFLLIMLLLVLFWAVKLFAMNLLSIIFRTHQNNHEYLLNVMIFTALSGLISLPLPAHFIHLADNHRFDIYCTVRQRNDDRCSAYPVFVFVFICVSLRPRIATLGSYFETGAPLQRPLSLKKNWMEL